MNNSTYLFLVVVLAAGCHAEVNITSVTPAIVFQGDAVPVTLTVSGYGLVNITSITVGGQVCVPTPPAYPLDYNLTTTNCLQKLTRDAICATANSQYGNVYAHACPVNTYPCSNASNSFGNCSFLTNLDDNCLNIACYTPFQNGCYLYPYRKLNQYASGAGFVGAPCDNATVCSATGRCVPNNPSDQCPGTVICEVALLGATLNNVTIATAAANLTSYPGVTAVPILQPVTVSSAYMSVTAGATLVVSPGTAFTVTFTPSLAATNASVVSYNCGPTIPGTGIVPDLGTDALDLSCTVSMTYLSYSWTAVLPGVIIPLTYAPVPVLFSACPAEVLSNIPTTIVVQGQQFYNSTSLTCLFNGAPVPVTFLKTGVASCMVTWTNLTSTQTAAPLTISNDGVTYATAPVQITIRGACGNIKPNSVPLSGTCVCQPGYQDMGGQFCQLCADGFYQPNYAQQGCIPCDTTENTAGILGSTSVGACVCKPGKYRRPDPGSDLSSCDPCPAGMQCNGNNSVTVLPGFWRATANSIIVTPCHAGTIECPGGPGAGNALCATGYKGPLCSVCKLGYGRLGSSCFRCPNHALNGFVLFVMICVALLCVYLLVKSTTREEAKGDTLGVTVKVLFSYMQVLYYVGKISANWSHKSSQFFASLIPVTLSPSFLSIQCATNFGFYKNIAVMMTLPLIIAAGLAILHLGLYGFKKTTYRGEVLWLEHVENYLKVLYVLLYLVHPTISQDVIRSFNCMSVPGTGTTYLTDDPRVDCSSKTYHAYVVVAALYVVFYIVGFLAFIMYHLEKHSYEIDLHHQGFHMGRARIYVFFVRGYRGVAHLWEFVIIFRKLGIVVINSLFAPQIQLVWANVIIAVSLFYTILVKPYKSYLVNKLDTLALTAIWLTIILGFHGEFLPNPKQFAIFVILALVNSIIAVILIAAVFKTLQPLLRRMFGQISLWLSKLTAKRVEFSTFLGGVKEDPLAIPEGVVMHQMHPTQGRFLPPAPTSDLPAPPVLGSPSNYAYEYDPEAEL